MKNAITESDYSKRIRRKIRREDTETPMERHLELYGVSLSAQIRKFYERYGYNWSIQNMEERK